MAEHDAAAFGIYRDRLSTANAIEALRAAGFRNMDIVALFPDEIGTWPISPKKPVKLIEGVLIGAIGGLAIASILMWLTELSRTSTGPALTLALLVVGGAAGSRRRAVEGRHRGRPVVERRSDTSAWLLPSTPGSSMTAHAADVAAELAS